MSSKTLREYLDEYAEGHTQVGTRITHMFGIPMIAASLPILPFNPLLGGGLFLGGWVLQFVGHYLFEKNSPKFFGDPFHLIVGVLWVAIEWAQLLGIRIPIPA